MENGIKGKTLDDYLARDVMSNIAKGRYNRQKVEEMFQTVSRSVAQDVERAAFEYCALMFLQSLHYDFGFGRKRLERFISDFSEKARAFDCGAYDVEDMRNALAEDTGVVVNMQWSGTRNELFGKPEQLGGDRK